MAFEDMDWLGMWLCTYPDCKIDSKEVRTISATGVLMDSESDNWTGLARCPLHMGAPITPKELEEEFI
jgi:hypothetical protein